MQSFSAIGTSLSNYIRGFLSAVLAALCVSQWLIRALFVCRSPFPLDYNGFYYLYEFKARALNGSAYYAPGSVFFELSDIVANIARFNEIALFQWWVLFSISAFALALACIPQRNIALQLGIAYVVLQSEPLFFLFYGYLKQALGCVLLAWSIVCALRLQKGILNTASAVALAVTGAIVHVWSGVIGAMALLFFPQRNLSVKVFAAIGVLIVAFRFYPWSNAEHLFTSISVKAPWGWSIPLSQMQLSPQEHWQFVVYAVTTLFLLFTVQTTSEASRLMWFFGCFSLALALPSWHDDHGHLFRFLMSSSPLSMLAIACAAAHEHPYRFGMSNRLLGSIVCTVLLITRVAIPLGPRFIGPSTGLALILPHKGTLERYLPRDAFVVAPGGTQFQVRYFLERASGRVRPKSSAPIFTIKPRESKNLCREPSEVSSDELKVEKCLSLSPQWVIEREGAQ